MVLQLYYNYSPQQADLRVFKAFAKVNYALLDFYFDKSQNQAACVQILEDKYNELVVLPPLHNEQPIYHIKPNVFVMTIETMEQYLQNIQHLEMLWLMRQDDGNYCETKRQKIKNMQEEIDEKAADALGNYKDVKDHKECLFRLMSLLRFN